MRESACGSSDRSIALFGDCQKAEEAQRGLDGCWLLAFLCFVYLLAFVTVEPCVFFPFLIDRTMIFANGEY